MRTMARAIGAGCVIDLVALRCAFAANVAIGRCMCGGRVHVAAIEPPGRGQRRWWIEMACERCGAVSALPGIMADSDVATRPPR